MQEFRWDCASDVLKIQQEFEPSGLEVHAFEPNTADDRDRQHHKG